MTAESRPSAAVWRAGDVIDGRYEVSGELGRGGMGVVHRVRHLGWGTDLAVKSPRPEMFRDAGDLERFVVEAETWVSLGLHPHVCTCHYVRTLGGVPRVFAEYVAGGSLRDRIADRRLYAGGPDEVMARIMDMAIQIAWGLEHAHGRGLVHRDVKPANVLVDDAGTAKITDFGPARVRAASAGTGPGVPSGASVPVTGSGGMTPAYASPEQAASRPLGRATDVYSFAVTVLEMLVGEVTWSIGPAVGAALEAYLDDGAGMAVPRIPVELADLLARCLRDEPHDRPRSMTEVAADLVEAYGGLTGGAYPRPMPRAAELRGDELNNRALSLLDLGRSAEAEQAFAEALAADPRHAQAAYHLGLLRWRQGAITDEALVTRLDAVRADSGNSRRARFLLAQVQMERGDLDAARDLLEGVAREDPEEPDVQAALRTVNTGRVTHARCTATREPAWRADPPPRTTLPVSLGADGNLALTGEADGTVKLWTLHDGRCRLTLTGHDGPVQAVDLSADGTVGVSAGADDTVLFWDLTEGRRTHAHRKTMAGSVRLSADGRVAVYSCQDGAFRVVDTPSGRITRKVKVDSWGLRSAVISPDGRWAMTSDVRAKAAVRLWDLATGECRHVLPEAVPGSASAGCFSADSLFAATYGGFDGPIRIWDVATGRCVRVLEDAAPTGPMSLSDGARYLLSAKGGYLRYWDVGSGRCVRTFVAHRGGTKAVRLSADGRSGLSTGDTENVVRWWRLPRERHVAAPSLSRPRPHTELSDLDTKVDALVTESRRALEDGRLPLALDLLNQARAIPGHERAPRVMSAWNALGRRVARTGLRGAWAAVRLEGHRRRVNAVDITADGRLAASAGDDRTVRVWDLGTRTCARTLAGHRAQVTSVCLSTDGTRLLSGAWDGEVRLWDIGSGECLLVLPGNVALLDAARWPAATSASECVMVAGGPPGGVPDAAIFGTAHVRFSADERCAVVGGTDGLVRLWDLGTGGLARAMDGVEHGKEGLRPADFAIGALAVGADGRLVASGQGSSVRLWDAREGRSIGTLHTPIEGRSVLRPQVTALCLSADGRFALFSNKATWKLHLWDIAAGRSVREMGGKSGWATGAQFTGDGRFAVSSHVGGIHVWDVGAGRSLRVLHDEEGKRTNCLASTPDGRFAVAGDDRGGVRLWELDWELAVV
ncbi:protein kinase domain-containing protein [Spirillospora sp. CA-255316]